VRLQRFLAEAGVSSRRAAEKLIAEGRVQVNEQVILEKGHRVFPGKDRITMDGRALQPKPKLYIALNKPRGYTCTRKDEHAERLVGDLLPAEWNSLYPVGRLDRDSEGLLFLTNDGEFCLRLTHPRYGIRKTYLATVDGRADNAMLDRFRKGVFSEGEVLRIEDGRVLASARGESLVELVLAEGRYHEVRRLFGSERMTVLRLVRTHIGPIKLGELKPGRWRTLTPGEVKTLLAPQ